MPQTLLTAQEQSDLRLASLIALAIREAGAEGLPSGPLYATLMNDCDIHRYTKLISILKSSQIIEERGHVLYWIKGV